jgi:lysophospholipase L1-like esterase
MALDKLMGSVVVINPYSGNYNKKFGFRFSPNTEETIVSEEFKYTVKTNSLGFRSKEIAIKEKDEYRVLLLGDSFFWGTGVDEQNTISAYLELFSKRLHPSRLSLSVYNYAVSGYNTNQQLLVLRSFAQKVQPDHVVLGFFPGNDVIPNASTFINEEGKYASHYRMIQRVKEDLRESFSFLFNSVIFRIVALQTYVPKIRYQIAIREEIIGKSYDLLEAFKHDTQSRGIRFSIIIIHPRDSVQGGIVQAWSNSRKVAYMLRDYCKKNDIEVVDLLDFMNGSKDTRKYFYPKDGHFNERGNFVVAKAIFDSLLFEHLKLLGIDTAR